MPTIDRLRLAVIDPNPYRDLEGNPLQREHIDHLIASIASNGFWDSLVVRPHPNEKGRYQLVFGHARIQAAREAGIEVASFTVRDLDDDGMIRAMADENVTQFGRDEYKTYREAVFAAVERVLPDIVHGNNPSKYFEGLKEGNDQQAIAAIRDGAAPGEPVIARYFNNTLPLGPIRLALQEYRDIGRLGEWHSQRNPKAVASTEPPKLSSAALAKFTDTAHVKEFADTAKRMNIPATEQEAIACFVLASLKEPQPKTASKSARGKRAGKQYARTEQPREERLTRANIRRVMTEFRASRSKSSYEKAQLEAEALAISVESAVVELSIGLKRAAKACGDLTTVADALGGLRADMTPSTISRLMECNDALMTIGAALKKAAKVGIKPLRIVGGKST
jgi:hypothetical protein